MADRRVQQEILEEGADPDELHDLMHCVTTPSAKGAAALKGLFEKLRLTDCAVAKEGAAYEVVGVQQTTLELDEIHKVAWILESRSPKARGKYLGWSLS